MKGFIITIVILAVVGIGGYLVYQQQTSQNTQNQNESMENEQMMENDNSTNDDAMMNENDSMMNENDSANSNDSMMENEDAKVFDLTGENFAFNVKEIKVKKGDKVTINLTSVGGFHDWVIDEFNAQTEKVNDGQSSSVTFVADKSGTFEYYCSVGQHRAMGMVGKLIVEE